MVLIYTNEPVHEMYEFIHDRKTLDLKDTRFIVKYKINAFTKVIF